jgi:hypothetical protein
MISCGSGSCGTSVIAQAGIVAKPKLPFIGCVVPSRGCGSSIRLPSRSLRNDDCQASGSCQPKVT